MKAQNEPNRELYTLPCTESGRALASLLTESARDCGRTSQTRQEIMEADGLVFRVLVVELGKRPREGEIASRMKQNMEAEWKTRVKRNANI